jgi:hypothetical protein
MTPAPLARTLAARSPATEGDDVRLAQRVLLALGYTALGEADGVYGAQTAAAVREFQRRAGLDADGVVGPQTWRRLLSPDAPAAEGAGPLIPLVDSTRGWLLGATRDGRWVDQGAAAILMRGGERYTRYAPGGDEPVTGSAPGPIGTPCDDTQMVLLDPPGDGVAVGEGLDARPRPVSAGDSSDAALLGRVRDLLRANGIASPEIAAVRVLEADLDGDGATERVVEATRIKGSDADAGPLPDAAAGDYSLVAIFPAKGEPAVLIGQYHPADETFTAPEQFQVDDLLDLNGDGRLEVVVYSRYYEGAATSVLALDGGKVTEALVNGCGV